MKTQDEIENRIYKEHRSARSQHVDGFLDMECTEDYDRGFLDALEWVLSDRNDDDH